LLTNAIKYSPKAKEKIIVHLSSDNNHAIVESKILVQVLIKKIKPMFQRFFRTRNKESRVAGFGLGLYISKEIIKRHKEKYGCKVNEAKEVHSLFLSAAFLNISP